jgi:hypothetical protein
MVQSALHPHPVSPFSIGERGHVHDPLVPVLADYNPPSHIVQNATQSLDVSFDNWPSLASPVDNWQSLAVPINPSYQSIPIMDTSRGLAAPPINQANSAVEPVTPGRHPCNWQGCTVSFSRKADRDRHIITKHRNIRYYHCRIAGCNKSRGSGVWKGYSRTDKLQEHMRKKHAGANASGSGTGIE